MLFILETSGLIKIYVLLYSTECPSIFFHFLPGQIYLLHYLHHRPSSALSETMNDKITHYLVHYATDTLSYRDAECSVLKLLVSELLVNSLEV